MAHTLLVVEDNVLLAQPLVRLLVRFGYVAEYVTSCKTARQLDKSFDVGVLDLELADGSGLDLSSELLERGMVGAVVFFSGTMDEALIHRAERIAPCVQKADGIAGLVQALQNVLGAEPQRAVGSGSDTPSPISRRP